MKNIENTRQQIEASECRYTCNLGLQNAMTTTRIERRLEPEDITACGVHCWSERNAEAVESFFPTRCHKGPRCD